MFMKPLTTVRIQNIDPRLTAQHVAEFLQQHGLSRFRAFLCPADGPGEPAQTATITFKSEEDAKRALSLHGTVLERFTLAVDREFFGLTLLSPRQLPDATVVE